MTPRENVRLRYVSIAQLMTYPAIYKLPFTLQLRYKPPGILLQGVTKSQEVHILSTNGLPNFITSPCLT